MIDHCKVVFVLAIPAVAAAILSNACMTKNKIITGPSMIQTTPNIFFNAFIFSGLYIKQRFNDLEKFRKLLICYVSTSFIINVNSSNYKRQCGNSNWIP